MRWKPELDETKTFCTRSMETESMSPVPRVLSTLTSMLMVSPS